MNINTTLIQDWGRRRIIHLGIEAEVVHTVPESLVHEQRSNYSSAEFEQEYMCIPWPKKEI